MGASFRMFLNPRFSLEGAYPDVARQVVSIGALGCVWDEVRGWPGYASTPIHDLAALATKLEVAEVLLKDESERFGLGSFKAIGGAYGALRVVQRELRGRGIEAGGGALRSGRYRNETADIVLTCATDGNHGRAVAWAARALGCTCVVYVPRIVSAARRHAIEREGAVVIRVDGTYDEALHASSTGAVKHRRLVVSDQSMLGAEAIPRDIMQGYAIVVAEAMAAIADRAPPTHVFVQAGVGGFAGAVCGYLWERCGAQRPRLVCVEPAAADCLYRSAVAGRMATVPGNLDTVMGCLSCAEPSTLGWTILEAGATAFMVVDDEQAIDAMKAVARGDDERPGVVLGESGAAGLAGLMAVAVDESAREQIGLDRSARVLLFGTEGANDPKRYEELVGFAPEEVSAGKRSTLG